MKNVNHKLSKEKGGALLITLAIMILLSVAAMMAVNTAQTDIDLTFNQLHADQAFYVAEAGLMKAFVTINDDNDWNAGYVNESFEGGLYTVAVVDSFFDPALADTVILNATATKEAAQANLQALIVPEYWRPFQYAMFGDSTLTMDNSTCTDSYNSDSGSYATTVTLTEGDLASNGTLDFTNTATVGGDASSAVVGGISVCATCIVHEDTATGIDPYVFEIVPDSVYDWARDNTSAPGGLSGAYSYNSLTYELDVNTNMSLTLAGGVYYFSDITFGSTSQINVAAGEQAVIYMTGDLVVGQNASINPGGAPENLIFFSKGDTFSIGNSTDMSAAFYGPGVDVSITNSVEYYGSIVSHSGSVINSACIHYDRALREYRGGKTGVMDMIAWRQL